MEKVIIQENQRGFLFKNGKFVKMLEAGKYYAGRSRHIEVVSAEAELRSEFCSLDVLLADEKIASASTSVELADGEVAAHFTDGNFSGMVRRGRHAFWSQRKRHEFKVFGTENPEIGNLLSAGLLEHIPPYYYTKIEVAEYQKARLYYDKRLVRLLDAGTYYFWRGAVKVEADFVDTRLKQMNITGQEILTKDKVALRINFICSYRVTDYVKSAMEIDNFEEQIHVAAQLALREYIGKYRIDEILEAKEQISQYVFDRLKEKEAELYVEITDSGVRDIVLPGEIRSIMNTVLIAEKRAQANVITRREEVASTRSLLNTAKLMDENQTLYKLKELEYLEKICANVGSINVDGSRDLLTQLTEIMRGKKAV